MKYCTHCGKQLSDEVNYCPYCGTATQSGEGVNNGENGFHQAPPPPFTQAPPPPPPYGYPPYPPKKPLNVVCLLGFIFSFINALIGLILSIVGMAQINREEERTSKNFATAGIIISSIILALEAIFVVIYCCIFVNIWGCWLYF